MKPPPTIRRIFAQLKGARTVRAGPEHGRARRSRLGTRLGTAQLELQQVSEQVVVPEPRPRRVQRDDERVRLLQILQHPHPARTSRQQVSQHAGAQSSRRGSAGCGPAPRLAGTPPPCARAGEPRLEPPSVPGRATPRATDSELPAGRIAHSRTNLSTCVLSAGRAVTGTRPAAGSAGGRPQTRRRTRPRPAPAVSRQ